MYGVGQGLNEGVRTAAGFVFDAMKLKQQQERFDATMDQRKAEMGQHDKLFHDRLAIEKGWKDGRYGVMEEELPPDAFPRVPAQQAPQPGQQGLPPDAFPRTPSPASTPQVGQVSAPRPMPRSAAPAQTTIRPMQMTLAQSLLPAPRIVGKPAREFMPSTLSGNRSRWPR